jgi:hypothetical protein
MLPKNIIKYALAAPDLQARLPRAHLRPQPSPLSAASPTSVCGGGRRLRFRFERVAETQEVDGHVLVNDAPLVRVRVRVRVSVRVRVRVRVRVGVRVRARAKARARIRVRVRVRVRARARARARARD